MGLSTTEASPKHLHKYFSCFAAIVSAFQTVLWVLSLTWTAWLTFHHFSWLALLSWKFLVYNRHSCTIVAAAHVFTWIPYCAWSSGSFWPVCVEAWLKELIVASAHWVCHSCEVLNFRISRGRVMKWECYSLFFSSMSPCWRVSFWSLTSGFGFPVWFLLETAWLQATWWCFD